jgi:Tfp pilus assembly protein PilF
MGGSYYGGHSMGGSNYGGHYSASPGISGNHLGNFSGSQHRVGSGMTSGAHNFSGNALNGARLGTSGLGSQTHSFSQSHAFSHNAHAGTARSTGSNSLSSRSLGTATGAHHAGLAGGAAGSGHHASTLLSHHGSAASHGGQFLSRHGGSTQLAAHHTAANHVGHNAALGAHHNLNTGLHNGLNHGVAFNHVGAWGNLHHGGWGGGRGWGGWGWGGRGFGGWGWGFGRRFFGFGFGFPGFGFGWGLGWGWPYWLNWGLWGLGGYGGFGYGGYGYGGYGYGGYGGGYGYGGYGYNPCCVYGSYYDPNALGYAGAGLDPATAVAQANPQAGAVAANQNPADVKPATKDADNARVFAEKGETDFKARDYKSAAYSWKHAAMDDPNNGVLVMMLAQAFFATGQYNDAAGAAQQGMQLLPKEEWGVVVKNYKELYSNVQDFTDQLRALEKAVKEKPNEPGLRFLAGFQYAYLGYPKEAVDQLDKGLKIAPRDELAKKLREEMTAKLPKPIEPPAPGVK